MSAPVRKPVLITAEQEIMIYLALDYCQARMTGLSKTERAKYRRLRNRFLGNFYADAKPAIAVGKAFSPVSALKAIAHLIEKPRPHQLDRIQSVIDRTDMTSTAH